MFYHKEHKEGKTVTKIFLGELRVTFVYLVVK